MGRLKNKYVGANDRGDSCLPAGIISRAVSFNFTRDIGLGRVRVSVFVHALHSADRCSMIGLLLFECRLIDKKTMAVELSRIRPRWSESFSWQKSVRWFGSTRSLKMGSYVAMDIDTITVLRRRVCHAK